MKYIFSIAALVAAVVAQDCQSTVSYKFEVSQANATLSAAQKRDFLERRVTTCTNSPVSTLNNGKLVDQDGSVGSILQAKADKNTQFQYDPAAQIQPGALAKGFCVNSNNTLSHPTSDGSTSAIFYNCHSPNPDGSINSKLYGDASLGFGPPALCSEVFLQVIQCEGGVASSQVHNAGGGTQTTGGVAATGASSESATSAPAITTSASTPATVVATTPAVAPAPYPVGNGTAPVPTGSASPSGSSVTTSATTSAPATFTPGSGANVLAIGSQVLAGVAAIGALALF